jgi:PAS domain S-box-containing protein
MNATLPNHDQPEVIRVLHVDDDPDFQDVAATLLERADNRLVVETATRVSEALDRLASETFDCIVSDYDMPEQNGIEFLEAVRTTDPNLPFILFTGKGSEAIASDAISAGVSDYLQKQGGTDQYAVLANRIVNLVEKFRAEQAQQRNRVLVEEATDVILVVGTDATIQYATPSAEPILGRTPKELVGTSGFAPIHPDDQEYVMSVFAELAEDPGGRRSTEFRYERPDGTWIWAEARGRNLTHTDIVDGIVIYTRDITEHKTHEQLIEDLHGTARELVQAETPQEVSETTVEAIRSVLDMPANAIHLSDETADGLAPVAWTDACQELVGTIPTLYPGESLAWDVFETGDAQVYDDVSTASGRLNPDTAFKSEIILPLGEHGVLLIGSSETDAFDETDLSLAQTLSAHATTVLDRIAREADIRTTTDRYRTLVDHFPAGAVFLYDLDCTCVLAGGQGLTDAGLSSGDVIGKRPSDRYPEAIAAELEGKLQDALDGESSVFEQTYQGRSYRIQTLPVEDGDHVMAVSQDITARKTREDALEALQQRTHALMHTTTKEETAQIAVDAAREILDSPLSGVHLLADSQQTLNPVAFLDTTPDGLGDAPAYDRTAMSDPRSQIVWGVFESGEPLVIDDTRDHGSLAEVTPVRSVVVHPLG